MVDPVRVKVIGVGGIGTWLVHALAAQLDVHAPESMLVLVDGDNFEAKNKERQHFTNYGNKALSVASTLRDQHNQIMIQGYPAWVVSEQDAQVINEEDEQSGVTKISAGDLLDDGDIVILCVDNFAARKLVFDAADKLANVDVFSGGNGDVSGGDALFGSVYHFCRRDGREITANPADYHDEFRNPTDRNPGELSCAERAKLEGGSQVVAANMTVAAIILAKISQTVLSNDPEVRAKAMNTAEIFFDWSEGLANFMEVPPVQVKHQENADQLVATATLS